MNTLIYTQFKFISGGPQNIFPHQHSFICSRFQKSSICRLILRFQANSIFTTSLHVNITPVRISLHRRPATWTQKRPLQRVLSWPEGTHNNYGRDLFGWRFCMAARKLIPVSRPRATGRDVESRTRLKKQLHRSWIGWRIHTRNGGDHSRE